MIREKRYWECIKDFVMEDGDVTHRKGLIYPSEGNGYHSVFMHDFQLETCVHEMDIRKSYFTDCFREIESIKIKEVPREKKYVEEYIEKLNAIDEAASDFTFSSIEFFGDGSGNIKDGGHDVDTEIDFNSLEELDKELAKIVAQ